MTAALEGADWSAARPGRTLPPGKTRYPFYRRLGGPQGRSGRARNLVPTGIRFRTVQPVVSRYTDWATRPTLGCGRWILSFTYTLSGSLDCDNMCRIELLLQEYTFAKINFKKPFFWWTIQLSLSLIQDFTSVWTCASIIHLQWIKDPRDSTGR